MNEIIERVELLRKQLGDVESAALKLDKEILGHADLLMTLFDTLAEAQTSVEVIWLRAKMENR